MEAVKEAFKKRAEGSRKMADQKIEAATDCRELAQRYEEEAAELRAEADELDRVRIAMYGADEVTQ